MEKSNNQAEELLTPLTNWIILLRRNVEAEKNWSAFDQFVKRNIQPIAKAANTRQIVSIADTYTDYGNPIERRNALYISVVVNLEKLFATRLLMYDVTPNHKKKKLVLKEPTVVLWDGVTSFHIRSGDMTQNLFGRIRALMEPTPELLILFETVLSRMDKKETQIGNLSKYHRNLLDTPGKKQGILRRIQNGLTIRKTSR